MVMGADRLEGGVDCRRLVWVKGQSLVMMGWSRRVIRRGVVSRLVEGETRRMLMGLEVEG